MSVWFWAKATAMLGADAARRRQILSLSVKSSIGLSASVLLCAALLVSSHPALAQFTQQGSKLVGTGTVGEPLQGQSVALSADGNTAIVGGYFDNGDLSNGYEAGAAWVYTRSGGGWTQQGSKLVGTGAAGKSAQQGYSVALSGDSNTAIVGGPGDNPGGFFGTGAAWVFTRSGGVWTQQGSKLVGTGAVGYPAQGYSIALSFDGNTAIVGGIYDNSNTGAAWVFTRSGGVWTQQGSKLVGTGGSGNQYQGTSVALSSDGNTAIVGGPVGNGAAWVYTRNSGVWTQQGSKLVGTGYVGLDASQGKSVALSSDGNTAIVGGYGDNNYAGATWVFIRSGSAWSQQGNKLIGTGTGGGFVYQGYSVALSADGNTAIVGGSHDNGGTPGATWVFTRSGSVWTQQGSKLVGTDAAGSARQGNSVALSADGKTAIVGGPGDNLSVGAAWIFVQPIPGVLTVGPVIPLNLHGPVGGPFASDMSGLIMLSNAGTVALNYSISLPNWLAVSPSSSGSLAGGASAGVRVFPGPLALGASAGNYSSTITFNNTTNGSGNTSVVTNLLINQSPGGRLGSNDQPLPIEGAAFNGPTLPLPLGQ